MLASFAEEVCAKVPPAMLLHSACLWCGSFPSLPCMRLWSSRRWGEGEIYELGESLSVRSLSLGGRRKEGRGRLIFPPGEEEEEEEERGYDVNWAKSHVVCPPLPKPKKVHFFGIRPSFCTFFRAASCVHSCLKMATFLHRRIPVRTAARASPCKK